MKVIGWWGWISSLKNASNSSEKWKSDLIDYRGSVTTFSSFCGSGEYKIDRIHCEIDQNLDIFIQTALVTAFGNFVMLNLHSICLNQWRRPKRLCRWMPLWLHWIHHLELVIAFKMVMIFDGWKKGFPGVTSSIEIDKITIANKEPEHSRRKNLIRNFTTLSLISWSEEGIFVSPIWVFC